MAEDGYTFGRRAPLGSKPRSSVVSGAVAIESAATRKKRGWKDYGFWALVVILLLSAVGNIGRILEDPEVRAKREAATVQRQQVAAERDTKIQKAKESAGDAVQNAYMVCKVIDGTGLASQPCEVSGWNSSVTMFLDMSGSEARKTCGMLVAQIKKMGMRFAGTQWTLQIKSPYSGDNSIAFCNLPR